MAGAGTARRSGVVMLAVALLGVLILGQFGDAGATHEPANKVSAAGSTTEVLGPGSNVTLLSEDVKTSAPTDLILGVTLECSLVTNVTTVGNDMSSAFGQVRVWIEIDGAPVLVSSDDAGGGKVTFCNRAYRRETDMFDDEDATIKTFFRTKNANSFTWLALNVGSAVHTIVVKAELTEEATSNAEAQAVVGNRTLMVEPVRAGGHEGVTELA